MLSSIEKTIILSGSIFGSVILFSNSLYCLNDIILQRNNYSQKKYDENEVNKLIVINGITMLFSGSTFAYFTYIGSK